MMFRSNPSSDKKKYSCHCVRKCPIQFWKNVVFMLAYSFIKVAGYQDMCQSLNGFDFGQDQTVDIGTERKNAILL